MSLLSILSEGRHSKEKEIRGKLPGQGCHGITLSVTLCTDQSFRKTVRFIPVPGPKMEFFPLSWCLWDIKDTAKIPPCTLAKTSRRCNCLTGKEYLILIYTKLGRYNNVVLKWDFKLTVNSRKGISWICDSCEEHNLFYPFSGPEVYWRVKTKAFTLPDCEVE